jgi:hypothetical protein
MAKQVNFLRERRKALSKVEQLDRRILMIMSYVFGAIFVVFFIVFGIRLYLDSQLNQVKMRQQEVRSQIVTNQDSEKSFVIFVNKLKSLSQIYQNRRDKKEAIEYFTNLFGADVFITQIEFDQKNKVLVFKLQSTDIFSLREVFKKVDSPEIKEKFTSVNPSDLNRLPDGRYEMSLAVVTEKKK